MKKIVLLLPIFFFCFLFPACNQSKQNKDSKEVVSVEIKENWVPLFNGENLDGWTAKIAGYPLGENFGNTFYVEDGLLKNDYKAYEDGFQSRYGHLFSDKAYSYFKLRAEYRFFGEQPEGAPGWAYLNNGIMFHSQSPETMGIDQWFPISIEAQLLANGDKGSGRTTGNVCTPGTEVWIDGELLPDHCATSSSKFYNWDEWVTFELEVYADSLARHIINGDTVLVYTNLTADKKGISTTSGQDISDEIPIEVGPLKSGYIAIQSEGHSTEFRKIEILDLSDQFNK